MTLSVAKTTQECPVTPTIITNAFVFRLSGYFVLRDLSQVLNIGFLFRVVSRSLKQ